MLLTLLALSAFAQDVNNDGCSDAQFAANGACVHPTAVIGSSTIGASASIGPYVELVGSVTIAQGAFIAGSSTTAPSNITGGTVIARHAHIGVDATIGADNTWSRSAVGGDRLVSQDSVGVGYAAIVGDDVTLETNAILGNLVNVGDYTTVGSSAVLARGVSISSSLSIKPANIMGIIGPEVSIGRGVQLASTVRVRKRADIGDDAVIEDNVRIGRDVQIEAGALVSSGAAVRANARVLAGVTVPSGYIVPRNTVYAGEASSDCEAGMTGPQCDQPLCTVCIDDDAVSGGSGECWTDPAADLKAMLDLVLTSTHQAACPSGVSVWVAEGTYTPSLSDRTASFTLDSGVSLFGGFAGNETQLSQRNITANPTVLSGDLNGNDGSDFSNRTDNANTVVFFDNADGSSALDGVTVQGGYADQTSGRSGRGGAVYVDRGTAVLRNLTILDNAAVAASGSYNGGGGVYANHATLTIADSTFADNKANALSSYQGGGALYAFGNSHIAIERSVFRNNTTPSGGGSYRGGGAIFARSSPGSPMGSFSIENSAFIGNDGGDSSHQYAGGGAILIQSLPLDVTNTLFSGNHVGNLGRGGAAYLMFGEESDPCQDQFEECLNTGSDYNICDDAYSVCNEPGELLTPINFTNCTFTGNSSNQGGALYFFQTAGYNGSEPTDLITNSIFGLNTSTDSAIAHSSADLAVTYSCLSDWTGGGTGNILSLIHI